jgi:hypothetical protein
MKQGFKGITYIIIISAIIAVISISCSREYKALQPGLDSELLRLSSLSGKELSSVLQDLDREDDVAVLYRDPAHKAKVLGFFSEMTGSEAVAKAILDNSERTGVPTSLAFALAFEESRFKTKAFNDNGGSVDRGLFQLNSKTFPKLTETEFYDAETNARYGLDHLDFCLRQAGNEVAALAMYNAGQGRVSGRGTPRVTLDYIYRVLKYQENIGSLFAARVVAGNGLKLALLPGRPE